VQIYTRRAILDTSLELRIQTAIKKFLSRAPLEESVLILGGPGLGVCTPLWILAFIGMARLKKIKAIHCFSGSAFYVLWYYAQSEGQLLLTPELATNWYLKNQKDRGVRPFITLMSIALLKLFRRPWVHPNEATLRDCIAGTLSPAFSDKPVSKWDANMHFWAYDEVSSQFIDLCANGPYPEFPSGWLLQATTAIPGLHEPQHYKGSVFSDPLNASGASDLLKQLRAQGRNTLFGHMHREFESADEIFVKMHSDPSGRRRLLWDYLVWISGAKNLEYCEHLRHGLFEIQPIAD
jgi:hypothetical protein